MKYSVRMTEVPRKFIIGLLSETKDDFVRAFRDLSKSCSVNGKRKFASDWISLAELAFSKVEKEDVEEKRGNFPDIVVNAQKEYNKMFEGLLPPCSRLTLNRRIKVESCFAQFGSDSMIDVFNQISSNSFLLGNNNSGFIADFDYIFTLKNYANILEDFRKQKGGSSC